MFTPPFAIKSVVPEILPFLTFNIHTAIGTIFLKDRAEYKKNPTIYLTYYKTLSK